MNERALGGASPAVSVPQQDADVVDDGRLAQLDLDPSSAVLLDGVPGEAVVQVVVLGVSVQQGRLELPLHHLGPVLHGGNVLLGDCSQGAGSHRCYNHGECVPLDQWSQLWPSRILCPACSRCFPAPNTHD